MLGRSGVDVATGHPALSEWSSMVKSEMPPSEITDKIHNNGNSKHSNLRYKLQYILLILSL